MSSTVDSSEQIQKIILETLNKDQIISDTRALGSELDQLQVIGVLKRLLSHQVLLLYE